MSNLSTCSRCGGTIELTPVGWWHTFLAASIADREAIDRKWNR
jgi:hypothetical protein